MQCLFFAVLRLRLWWVDHIRISNLFKPHKTRDDATTRDMPERGVEERTEEAAEASRGGKRDWEKKHAIFFLDVLPLAEIPVLF